MSVPEPVQAPPEQTSVTVQALPSLQAAVLFVWTATPFEQESLVQGLLSLRFGILPDPAQPPPEQTSVTVQALPSLQAAVLFVWTATPFEQESLVQGLLSLRFGILPDPAQPPPEQTSVTVQALPSLQAAVLFVWTATPFEQESLVQGLLSLRFGIVPEPVQAPPEQTSVTVQALPSLQAAVLFVWTAAPLTHVSVAHTLLSFRFGIVTEPVQAPPEQTSVTVQALPSLQAAVLFVWTAAPLTHVSVVHTLLSLRFGIVPEPVQAP